MAPAALEPTPSGLRLKPTHRPITIRPGSPGTVPRHAGHGIASAKSLPSSESKPSPSPSPPVRAQPSPRPSPSPSPPRAQPEPAHVRARARARASCQLPAAASTGLATLPDRPQGLAPERRDSGAHGMLARCRGWAGGRTAGRPPFGSSASGSRSRTHSPCWTASAWPCGASATIDGTSQREHALRSGCSKSHQARLESQPGQLKLADVLTALEGTSYHLELRHDDDGRLIEPVEWYPTELVARFRRRTPVPRGGHTGPRVPAQLVLHPPSVQRAVARLDVVRR